MSDGFDRRELLFGTFGALLGFNLHCSGCRRSSSGGGGTLVSHPPAIEFPMIEVSGTPYETGKAIGKRFGENVKKGLRRRNEWFTEIRTFMEQDLKNRYEPFLAAGKKHHPEIVEELRKSTNKYMIFKLGLKMPNIPSNPEILVARVLAENRASRRIDEERILFVPTEKWNFLSVYHGS